MTRAALALLVCAGLAARAADERPARPGGSRKPVQSAARCDVPAHPVDVILGRPTRTSVTVRVLCYADAEACVAFGPATGRCDRSTAARPLRAGEPADFILDGLPPDTALAYRLRLRPPGAAEFREEPEARFRTARAPGRPFVFTVTADPHLDENTDPGVYQRTLAAAAADAPDFHVDLGDTFMTGKHPDRASAARQYLAQRCYFGALCRSAPLFLALGNHDGEGNREFAGGGDSLGAWATGMRTRYFPNPEPDGFYTGDEAADARGARPQDYYAWEWGDALLVVLAPFRHRGPAEDARDNWARSLGEAQYRWLAQTLEASRARHKLVFIHHLVGGATREGRGGAEAAPYFEWGGRNLDGTDAFAARRPGWPMPIRDLLARHGVEIVFHGHDHFYARQEAGGLVYQLVPQPGGTGGDRTPRFVENYTYRDGVLLGGAGYLRVAVSPERLAVDFVRADRTVARSYSRPSPEKP